MKLAVLICTKVMLDISAGFLTMHPQQKTLWDGQGIRRQSGFRPVVNSACMHAGESGAGAMEFQSLPRSTARLMLFLLPPLNSFQVRQATLHTCWLQAYIIYLWAHKHRDI